METKDIQQLQEQIRQGVSPLQLVKAEMGRIISGQSDLIDRMLLALVTDGHILLEGVPGLAKTLAVKTLAQTLDGSFSRLQFTPDLLPADLIGTRIYNAASGEFSTKTGPVFANIVLADEINRASPKTQSSLLEAMEEKSVTVDGVTYDIPRPFFVIATQNPTGYVGTYPLPEAQIDRFGIKLSMGYPAPDEEVAIIRNRLSHNPLKLVKPVCNAETVYRITKMISGVHVDDSVLQYIVSLVNATRKHPAVALGASPRATVAIMHIARSFAFMHRRAYVVPEDIAELFPQTVAHRLVLTQEARMARIEPQTVIAEVLASVRPPIRSKR